MYTHVHTHTHTYKYIYISAVKRLITSKNNCFCLHNIGMCAVYIYKYKYISDFFYKIYTEYIYL